MRRQDYLRLYSQTRALRGNAAEAIKAPKDTVPSTIPERDTEHARGYGQWVMIYQRTSGESDLITLPYLVKSSEALTPAEAEAQAEAYLQIKPDRYNRVTIGVGYVGTERFTPRPSERW
jgi:hypothetical protein